MLKIIPMVSLILIFLLLVVTSSIFGSSASDVNDNRFRTYELHASKPKVRCNIIDLNRSPKSFKLDNEIVRSQVTECPNVLDGSRSEHAVLSLCNATNYPKDCGFLPDNWIAIGEDMETRCEKNISIDGTFPIATFDWVKMPNPSRNFHRFYDGGHSAIFLSCLQEQGVILVADQWCGATFGVRKIRRRELNRYFEIGSFTQNPRRFGLLNSAQHVIRSVVSGLAKTVEHAVRIKSHANHFTHVVKGWQWKEQTRCFPALLGPFRQQTLPPSHEMQSNMSNFICNKSTPGNFVYITSRLRQNRYLLNLTLKTDCRLAIEIRYERNDSLIIQQEFGPDDEPNPNAENTTCQDSVCCQFDKFYFNDHGCYQGIIQLSAVVEISKRQSLSSIPFEVCPVTLDYETHQIFHEDSLKSEFGYSKSASMNVDKCTDVNIPKKKYLHRELLINGANESHAVDIFLFVDNRDCQLQLDIIDENEFITSSSLGRPCHLCKNYVFPAKFSQKECHVSSITNVTGERAVICHCLKRLNEYSKYGDKCFEGELVVQLNSLWNNYFIRPTEYDIYSFDVCANIKKNQSLPCKQTSYAEYHTKVDFAFSRSNRKTQVNVDFVVDENCHLQITLKKNDTILRFNDIMNWGYDEKVPIEYTDSRCNVESVRDGSNTKERICFRFAESRFHDYCFRGVIVLQKSVVDARNWATPESAVPVAYELCAPPFPTGSPKLFTSYEEYCIQVNETIIQSLRWRNISGEGHIENLDIQIVRNENCELILYVTWKGEQFRITFYDTNVKIEDQRSRDRKCLGHDVIICFTLPQQQSTSMGCIEGLLRWIAMERHTTDFYRLLTEGDAHFKACPSICNTNNVRIMSFLNTDY